MPRHLALDGQHPQVRGEVFYSASSMAGNKLGFATAIHDQYFAAPAIPPVFADRSDGDGPVPPGGLRAVTTPGRVELTWTGESPAAFNWAINSGWILAVMFGPSCPPFYPPPAGGESRRGFTVARAP